MDYPLAEKKKQLRQHVKQLTSTYSPEELKRKSLAIWDQVEELAAFQLASTLLCYHSMPGEVYTHAFIEHWYKKKTVLLPIVIEGQLKCGIYRGLKTLVPMGTMAICEPEKADFTDYHKIGLAIVPGLAFDKDNNRLGRGKGYYDRFLPQMQCPKIAVCFSFQLFDSIPAGPGDHKMDKVINI